MEPRFADVLGDLSESPLLLTPMVAMEHSRMPFPTCRSTEVPSVRSAQQKFDFTSAQPRSTVMAPMFDPPHVPLRITAMVLHAHRLVAKTTNRAVEKDRAFW
jgi:hypothetical protein